MKINNKPTILVTGATGLVGTAVVARVLSQFPKAQVRGSYFGTAPFYQHHRLTYVQADLTTKNGCQKAARGCDMAVMAAACTGGAKAAMETPSVQVSDNMAMDALMLDAAYHQGIQRVVYLSSATVYQDFAGAVKEEELDWNQDPHHAYLGVGWAKRAAEKLCYFWHVKYDLDILVVRCANIYGPHAKFDASVSNFIPALIKKGAAKMDPFQVWGSPDVERDVIYADDAAHAIVSLLGNPHLNYGVYNLGSGRIVTVGEVVNLVLVHCDHHPNRIEYLDQQPTTIRSRTLDCTRIQTDGKWKPVVSIDEGIARTSQWWMRNKQWWTK